MTEPGDLAVYDGKLYRIVASRGRNKRDAGELTYVEIHPPESLGNVRAVIIGSEICWVAQD